MICFSGYALKDQQGRSVQKRCVPCSRPSRQHSKAHTFSATRWDMIFFIRILIIKFICYEKVTKIWRNLQVLLEPDIFIRPSKATFKSSYIFCNKVRYDFFIRILIVKFIWEGLKNMNLILIIYSLLMITTKFAYYAAFRGCLKYDVIWHLRIPVLKISVFCTMYCESKIPKY